MRALLLVVVVASAACRIHFDERPDAAVPPGFVAITGNVSGLTGSGLVLQNNGGDDLAIRANGPFAFATPLAIGAPYAASVSTQPSGQACSLANASGVAGGAVDVEVTCYAAGACPPIALTFMSDGMFTLPTGCPGFTVTADGGGGAGGALNMGSTAAAGGAGGHAVLTLAAQAANTQYAIAIGMGGTCASKVATAGGYAGGAGGNAGGFGNGGAGAGTASPPGGAGGAGSTGIQPGGAGGNGGYGGGGGGGGGDLAIGNSGGGATTFRFVSPAMDIVVAGGGGAAGAADQNGDVAGAGGDACTGYVGFNGAAAVAGSRSAGGGGGGACFCLGGACDTTPSETGGAPGIAGTGATCTAAQNGAPGRVVISFP